MHPAKAQTMKAQPLTREAYAAYGAVIAADEALPHKPANFGRARRYNYLSDAINLRGHARPNICVFRCSPWVEPVLEVKLLERHPFSTQIFLPMQDGRYVTIVALGDDRPDLTTLAAFIIDAPLGISYHPGVWHYPMTALGRQLDMACLVYEDDSAGDCDVCDLPAPVVVEL